MAHDAETGERLWITYTVPARGEPGYETWSEHEIEPLGGLTWNTISYDPELRWIYLGTGQPTPWSSTLRGPGDALYTNSILAIDIDTGELQWHFQVVPSDNWDLDATHESMLVDLVIGGVERKALIETSKIGWGVVLDRVTGQFLGSFRDGLRQPHHRLDRHRGPDLQPRAHPHPGRRRLGPGVRGLPALPRRTQPELAELQPRERVSTTWASTTAAWTSRSFPRSTGRAASTGAWRAGSSGSPTTTTSASSWRSTRSPASRAWEHRFPGGAAMTAAALSTAGGLVFGGTADRRLFALDAETGALLWERRLNGDISGAPITFEVGGRQYLAVGAGGRIGQTTSYARLTNTRIPQGTGVMWVFALP